VSSCVVRVPWYHKSILILHKSTVVTQNVRVANDADDPECAPISGSLVEQQLNKPEPNTGLLPETPISEKFPQPKIKVENSSVRMLIAPEK